MHTPKLFVFDRVHIAPRTIWLSLFFQVAVSAEYRTVRSGALQPRDEVQQVLGKWLSCAVPVLYGVIGHLAQHLVGFIVGSDSHFFFAFFGSRPHSSQTPTALSASLCIRQYEGF